MNNLNLNDDLVNNERLGVLLWFIVYIFDWGYLKKNLIVFYDLYLYIKKRWWLLGFF